jgi:hypothetical protein
LQLLVVESRRGLDVNFDTYYDDDSTRVVIIIFAFFCSLYYQY